jgi:hypothetical protein
MRVEVYGQKAFEEKIKKYIKERIKSRHIAQISVYLYNIPKECIGCIYFPCEESCKTNKRIETRKHL